MTTDVEREAFELEMGFVDKPRREDGEYKSDAVQHRWDGWQAGAAWQRAQSAPVVPEGYRWYLVPKEDTDAFNAACSAANDAYLGGVGPCGVFIAGYRAMLAAAPQPARQPLELSISPEWVRKAAEAEQGHVIAAGVPDPAARQEQGDEVRRLREALEKARRIASNARNLIGGIRQGQNVTPDEIWRACEHLDGLAALTASAEGKA